MIWGLKVGRGSLFPWFFSVFLDVAGLYAQKDKLSSRFDR